MHTHVASCEDVRVSLSEWGIFASIAEFERELIRDRVRSGMAAARARGARIGRPRKFVDADKVTELRAQGASWRAIARELGVGIGTVRRAAQEHSRKDSVAGAASGRDFCGKNPD